MMDFHDIQVRQKAYDLKFLENQKYQELNDAIVEIKRMLTSFIKTLRKTNG